MGEPVRFEVVKNQRNQNEVPTYYVVESKTGRRASWWAVESRARAAADLLNREHRGGRVAQAVCCHGEACDRDRINWGPMSPENRAAVVLCDRHAAEIDAARAA